MKSNLNQYFAIQIAIVVLMNKLCILMKAKMAIWFLFYKLGL